MKLKNLLGPTLLFAAAAFVLIAPTSETEAQATKTINFGTVAPEGTPWADQLNSFKSRIESESNGAIQVKVFMSGSMGGEVEMVRDCRRGERLQAIGVSTGAMSVGAGVPILEMVELPYLFESTAHADNALDNVLYDDVTEDLAAKGFVMNTWAENGWRSMAAPGPIHTPADLSAYKMRSQESDVHKNMYTAWNTQYVTKPTSEVTPALSNGIVDGFDNTPLFSLASGWILAGNVKHYSLTKHIYQPAVIVYSKKFWDTLTPDLQTVVAGNPTQEAVTGRAAVRAMESSMIKIIEKKLVAKGGSVVTLTDAERQVFADEAQTVHTQFLAAHPELKGVYAEVKAAK